MSSHINMLISRSNGVTSKLNIEHKAFGKQIAAYKSSLLSSISKPKVLLLFLFPSSQSRLTLNSWILEKRFNYVSDLICRVMLTI